MYIKHIFKLCIFLIYLNQLSAQCINTTLINPNSLCLMMYDPVCGCNGKTYDNTCSAEITDGVTSTTLGMCAIDQSGTICLGNNVQLGVNPNPQSTYAWNPTNNLSCVDCANPTAEPTSTTLYELTTTDVAGVLTYIYFEIIVDPCTTPTQTNTICLGSDVQIGSTPNAENTYTWNPTNNLSCVDCANPTADPTNTTTYQLTTTDAAGNSTTSFFEIIVDACPTQTNTICLGFDVQIGSTPNAENTYTWNPSNNLSCVDCADPTADPTNTTTYQLTTTNAAGNSTTSFFEIIVDACPTQTNTICLGSDVQIGSTPNAENTYTWNPTNNLSCVDCADPTADPTNTTTYQLTTTNAAGNSTTAFFEVIVNQCASICANNEGFSYQINDIEKIGDDPAAQFNLVVNFTENSQRDDACIWSWDFGNGATSADKSPQNITFSTLNNGEPVTQPYNVCMSVFSCTEQLIETCCQTIGPFENCQDNTFINTVQNCDTTLDPVCGCNTKSYPSGCNAINTDGVYSYTDGPCSIDAVYQICEGQTVRIGLPNFVSGIQYSWLPKNAISCGAGCFQTTASPNQSTLYQLTMLNNATGKSTYKYYQVEVLSPEFCCTSNSLIWLDDLLDDDFCNTCYAEVKQIEINGLDYVYFEKDTIACPNAFSSLKDCSGAVYCNEDSTGFCLDTLTYTVVDNIWSKDAFCNLCNVTNVNEIDWLYNTYGNGNYEVGRYSFNSDIAFYVKKCNATAADTLTKMLVNCNNDIICGWDGSTPVIDNANCNSFFSEGVFVEQLISCGCIDVSKIDPSKNCPPFGAPICGCNGKTYTNFCFGQKFAGITSWTVGACNDNSNCIDTVQVFNGFLESQELKAKQVVQVSVPIVGNNLLKIEAEQTVELLSGFECPKNTNLQIGNKICY